MENLNSLQFVVLLTTTVLSGAARGRRGVARARVAESRSSVVENNMADGLRDGWG
jgi:hypothetical protein